MTKLRSLRIKSKLTLLEVGKRAGVRVTLVDHYCIRGIQIKRNAGRRRSPPLKRSSSFPKKLPPFGFPSPLSGVPFGCAVLGTPSMVFFMCKSFR